MIVKVNYLCRCDRSMSNHLFKIITISLLLSFIAYNGQGQDTTLALSTQNAGNPYVRWVCQFPIPLSERKKTGLFKKVGKFFFGKPPVGLNKPISVFAKDRDTLWILDQGNWTVIRVNDKVAEIPKYISNEKYKYTSLVGITPVSDKEMLFTDSRLNRIFCINLEKEELKILNDSLKLEQPTGIAYSSVSNEIWVVETAAHRISILNKEGEVIKTIGKRGTAPGEFNFPTAIWIDKAGDAYVVDAMNFRIQIFDKDGKFVTNFGKNGDAAGDFARPKGIATDTFGNIYVADALFHVVQIFDKAGNLLYKFGKQGHGDGEFWMPAGVYIDDQNYIYVADSYNSRIQIFQLMNGR